MSVSEEKRRLMAEFDDLKKHLRGSPTTNHGENDPLAELARVLDEQKDYKSVLEPRGQRSAETREDARDPTERKALPTRKRILSDFAAIEAPSEPATSNAILRGAMSEHLRHADDTTLSRHADIADQHVRPQRSRYLMAAIIIVGVAGLAASLAVWSGALTPREPAAIRIEAELPKRQPERTTGAEVPAQDASSLDPSPAALGDNAEQPADALHAQEKAPPTDAGRDDRGPATDAASVAAPPAQAHPEAEPQGAAAPLEPEETQTMAVQPDGPAAPHDTPPQAPLSPPAAIRSGGHGQHVQAVKPARAKAVKAKPEQVFIPAEAPAPPPAPTAAPSPAPVPATNRPFAFFHSAVDSLTGVVEDLGRLATGSRP